MATNKCEIKIFYLFKELTDYELYYKSRLELKSISREILSVNCNFICDFTPT